MQSVKDLNAEIMKITLLIEEKYPELSKYINEMPATIPIDEQPKINAETLQKYYSSLKEFVKKYQLEHPKREFLL